MKVFSDLRQIAGAAGSVLGVSDWLTIDQDRIDRFADVTGDRQWIHVDTERAASGPFGSTIAHGYLTLALLPRFMTEVYRIDGPGMSVNYGLDKVRFITPVKVGSRVRGVVELAEVTPVERAAVQMRFRTTVEIEGAPRPACVAETVGRRYFQQGD